MELKKILCLILALALCAALFAACGKTKPEETTAADNETAAAADTDTTAAEEETNADETAGENTDEIIEIAAEDRIPEKFAGDYECGRCTIEVTAINETEMKFLVHWGSSAMEFRQWEMSGTFDADTLRVNYSDCVCKDMTADENGNITEAPVYEDGIGRIQFYGFDALGWMDEQDNAAQDMEFTKLAPAE